MTTFPCWIVIYPNNSPYFLQVWNYLPCPQCLCHTIPQECSIWSQCVTSHTMSLAKRGILHWSGYENMVMEPNFLPMDLVWQISKYFPVGIKSQYSQKWWIDNILSFAYLLFLDWINHSHTNLSFISQITHLHLKLISR